MAALPIMMKSLSAITSAKPVLREGGETGAYPVDSRFLGNESESNDADFLTGEQPRDKVQGSAYHRPIKVFYARRESAQWEKTS